MKRFGAVLGFAVAFAGVASAQHYISPDADVAIPDNTDAFDSWQDITIPAGAGIIADLDVGIIIDHTWQGDLNVEIEHLDTGTRVSLLHRAGDSDGDGAGFSADNYGGSQGEFMLDDEAAAPYDSAAPDGWGSIADPGIADVAGSWQPYGSLASGSLADLSAFDGEDSAGTWRLYVSDNAGGDLGNLTQFSMWVTIVPEPASLALLALGGLVAFRRR